MNIYYLDKKVRAKIKPDVYALLLAGIQKCVRNAFLASLAGIKNPLKQDGLVYLKKNMAAQYDAHHHHIQILIAHCFWIALRTMY